MADRLTTADYFGTALEILGEQGSEAMTIATLCDALSVTKGSFYHHFGGLPGFVEQLLAYWEAEHGDALIAVSRPQPDPGVRFRLLIDTAAALPHASEAAMRAWGRSQPEVAEAVARVDKRREKHVSDAIVAIGIDRPRARQLGRMALHLVIGTQARERPVDVRRLRQMLEEFTKLIQLAADTGLAARVPSLV